MAMSSRQQQAHDAGGDLDPVYEWLDDGGSYLLRLNLAGFKKEDFRVHVDADGRLTILGQQGRAPRLHKAFQLPNTADLDGITGRFDGTVLTLTVPKLRHPGAAASPLPTQTEDKEGEAGTGEPREDKKAVPKHAEAAERRVETEKASLMLRGKEDKEDKRKAAPPPVPGESAKAANGVRRDDHQDEMASKAAEHMAYVAREAARRIEAARAKMAEAERTGGQWMERAASEGLKWAETIGQKKEVIATAVAAFTLGVFVSQAFARR